MKSKCVILVTVCLFSNQLFSQEIKNSWGLKLGPNFSKVTNLQSVFSKDLPNNELKKNLLVGYEIGINYNLKINKSLEFQPEIQLTQYGYKVSNGDDHLIRKYNLISSNLLMNINLSDKKIRPFFVVGPFIGYKLSQYADMVYKGTILGDGKSSFLKNLHNRFDYGVIGGLGLQFKVGKPIINIQGRYQLGFANPIINCDCKNHSRVISINFGVQFPITK